MLKPAFRIHEMSLLGSKVRPARRQIASAVRRDMSIAKCISHSANLRRSGTKRLLISHVAPTELGLIYWRKSYKHFAPNGASALQHKLSTEPDEF